jgi:hypothetical protein
MHFYLFSNQLIMVYATEHVALNETIQLIKQLIFSLILTHFIKI